MKKYSWLSPAIFGLIWVAGWEIAVRRQDVRIIPGPWEVLEGIAELGRKGLLTKYIVASLFRVTWGYLLAITAAIPLGLILGWRRRAEMTLNPVIQILRPISPLAWIPLAILWFGVGDVSAIFLIFLAAFLPLTVSTMNAVRNIPAICIQAGRNFGLSQRQLAWRVLFPAILPQLIVGLRLALGIAWLVVVAAEMIAVNSGLGFLIIDSRNAGNRYDLVVAGMVLIGFIGLLLDTGMRSLERILSLRWGYGTD
ncbi:MAG: ABC transporter permease [Terriglobia bacterium]